MSANRKKLIKKLDSLVKELVLLRDKSCVICGESDMDILASGHYFSRYFLATRFDLKNNNAQCHKCNFYHEENPGPYREYMLRCYGKKNLEELNRKKNEICIMKDWQLEELLLKMALLSKKELI